MSFLPVSQVWWKLFQTPCWRFPSFLSPSFCNTMIANFKACQGLQIYLYKPQSRHAPFTPLLLHRHPIQFLLHSTTGSVPPLQAFLPAHLYYSSEIACTAATKLHQLCSKNHHVARHSDMQATEMLGEIKNSYRTWEHLKHLFLQQCPSISPYEHVFALLSLGQFFTSLILWCTLHRKKTTNKTVLVLVNKSINSFITHTIYRI